MSFIIKEVYDGRLPEFHVLSSDKVIKIFDSLEEAQLFVEEFKTTCCGEENPCD